MTYYTFDIYGRYAGDSEVATERSTQVAPPDKASDFNWNHVEWVFTPTLVLVPVVSGPAPRLVPPEISPRQIRHALTAKGWRDDVEALVSAADQDMQDWWATASVFERANPLVVATAAQLGRTDYDLDELFILGGSL